MKGPSRIRLEGLLDGFDSSRARFQEVRGLRLEIEPEADAQFDRAVAEARVVELDVPLGIPEVEALDGGDGDLSCPREVRVVGEGL
jgi:hypothetical protein